VAEDLYDLHLPSTGGQVNAYLINSQDVYVLAAEVQWPEVWRPEIGWPEITWMLSSGAGQVREGGAVGIRLLLEPLEIWR
jgi:hypothetical protein